MKILELRNAGCVARWCVDDGVSADCLRDQLIGVCSGDPTLIYDEYDALMRDGDSMLSVLEAVPPSIVAPVKAVVDAVAVWMHDEGYAAGGRH